MAFDFPASPIEGQTFTPPGGPSYIYHAPAWQLVSSSSGGGGGIPDAPSDGSLYGRLSGIWSKGVKLAGDTMTGLLTLSGAPTAALHAATKAYADTKVPIVGTTTITGGITLTGGLAVGTNMTVGTSIQAGTSISANGRVKSNEAGGFFADDTGSFFGFNGDASYRQFYFNSVALWQFNKATADLMYIASPYNMLHLRYADNAMVLSGYAYKPGGGAFLDASDARIKTVEGDYTRGLEDVAQLRPVLYTYKGNDTSDAPAHLRTGITEEDVKKSKEALVVPYPNSPHHAAAQQSRKFTGLVAQEVETIIPEMVKQRNGYIDGAAVTDLRDLDTTPLIFALVNAVKELKLRVEELETR